MNDQVKEIVEVEEEETRFLSGRMVRRSGQ